MSQKTNIPIFIVGESGTGKSTGIRTLNPKTTLIINTEDKRAPFEGDEHFKIVNTMNLTDLMKVLRKLEGKNDIKIVVIDSFTSMVESISRSVYKNFAGWDRFSELGARVGMLLRAIKKLEQQVIVIGIPEIKKNDPDEKQYIRMKGEMRYGEIEKEFTIVMFTSPIWNEETDEMDDVEMMVKPNRTTTTKTPMGMFKKRPRNDYAAIIKQVHGYYKIK